ncbi:MAG: iron ABC transporter permease [Chloroflexota bacterium]|nr:iron ABC transporter permease [Chloroflexota bacterium]
MATNQLPARFERRTIENRLHRRRRRRPPIWLWLPALLIGIVVLLPLVYLVARASEGGEAAWLVIARPRTVEVVVNTIALVGAVAASTVVIAVPLAWLTTRTDLPGRRVWATVSALPLVIPSYVGALVLVAAVGPRGMLQGWLEPLGVERLPSIYGFWGSWLALTLFTYPYTYLSVRAAWRGLDPGLEEAARGLGQSAWQAFHRVTLPQLRPAIGAGALLVALYCVADFGVVSLLRFDAFTRAIYVQYQTAFDRSAAAALALLLVGFTVALLIVETRIRGRATLYRVSSGSARSAKPVGLGHWKYPAVGFCATIVALALGLPLVVLGFWLGRTLLDRDPGQYVVAAALTSLTLGFWTAVLATAAALPLAILAVRYPGWLGTVAERSSYLGYALPGIVLAIAFVALAVRTPWYQTLPLLIVACTVRFLPQAVGSTRLSLLQVSPRLEEAARGLGHSVPRVLTRVTLPLVRPGLLAGASLVLLTTMKELPVTLLLIPIGERTLPTLIWTAAGDARYGEAALPALLLVAVSALPTLLLAVRDQAPLA